MFVDTLGESIDYEPYAPARAFYPALGFRDPARVLQDDPGYLERLKLALDLAPQGTSGVATPAGVSS